MRWERVEAALRLKSALVTGRFRSRASDATSSTLVSSSSAISQYRCAWTGLMPVPSSDAGQGINGSLTPLWTASLAVDGLSELVRPSLLGFRRMEAMTKHRSHSAAFKRQVAAEFLAGETLHGLSQRHDVSRQLIRIWVGKFEAGALDEDVQAADLIQEYEAKIAALERLVGRQALEIELLKGR